MNEWMDRCEDDLWGKPSNFLCNRSITLGLLWPFYLSKVPANHANSICAAHVDDSRIFLNILLSLSLVTHKDIIRCLTQKADIRD
jgi:hypothetical protein